MGDGDGGGAQALEPGQVAADLVHGFEKLEQVPADRDAARTVSRRLGLAFFRALPIVKVGLTPS